jgi:uncharacterized LabA/DUF88 family protein
METRVAVFFDFENIKRSVDDFFENERVDIKRILTEVQRVTGGRIIIKRAYADWGAFKDYRSDLLDNACEPVQTFALSYKGKNGADIRIAIDVMDVVLRQENITHVALVSGDSDFTPLVMKLREFNRMVIGVGVRSNTSNYLAKSCDTFCFYDDILREDGETLPKRSVPSTPQDPVALLAMALAALGNRPVSGSALKTQMRKIDPMFDETQHGHISFLDFLRSHGEVVDLHKPAVGDVTVAPKGMLNSIVATTPAPPAGNGATVAESRPVEPRPAEPKFSHPGYTPYVPSPGIPYQAPPPPPPPPPTPGERYRVWLRENNFRYVPHAERHEIIRAMFDIFADAEEAEEPISLKEAKDRLHAWFEENRPAVPWESINSTVYHLFYTWCFEFDKSEDDGNKQLWDRRTSLKNDIQTADDLIGKSEKGVIRKLWERDRGEVDIDAMTEWLYDGDDAHRETVSELIRAVQTTAHNYGGSYNTSFSSGYGFNPAR